MSRGDAALKTGRRKRSRKGSITWVHLTVCETDYLVLLVFSDDGDIKLPVASGDIADGLGIDLCSREYRNNEAGLISPVLHLPILGVCGTKMVAITVYIAGNISAIAIWSSYHGVCFLSSISRQVFYPLNRSNCAVSGKGCVRASGPSGSSQSVTWHDV